MVHTYKIFRVFISSTFDDLIAERNAFQEKVYPKLIKYCKSNGTQFQPIDLRWGISKEAALNQLTMEICLNEIKRCKKLTPKPNFLIILGNRYGYQPIPSVIKSNEFELMIDNLKGNVKDIEEKKSLLLKWYKRDDNTVLSEYCLQPREDIFTELENWKPVQDKIHDIFNEVIQDLPISEELKLKYYVSATEQEIINGVLKDYNAKEHVYCFLREIKNIKSIKDKKFIDINDEGNIDQGKQKLLKNLKSRLRDRLPKNNLYEYTAEVIDGEITKNHINKLCDDVYNALYKVIKKEIKKIEQIDPLDKEIMDHDEFCEILIENFVGRKKIIDKVTKNVDKEFAKPLIIYGNSGSGKSSIMAKLFKILSKKYPKTIIISRFIGATPHSLNKSSLLESLYNQISNAYGTDKSPYFPTYYDLVKEFNKSLSLANSAKPLILILDAINFHIVFDDPATLDWLPEKFPAHVKLIISTLPEYLSILKRKLPDGTFLEIESLPKTDAEDLLDKWFDNIGRKLQKEQKKEILRKFQSIGFPIYLKLAFEESRHWKSYKKYSIAPTIPGIIKNLFGRLSDDINHGKTLISRALGYLAAAKDGLSEIELMEILTADDDVWKDFKRRSFTDLPERKLPMVIWSRLYLDLEPYLTSRIFHNSLLLTFYHDQIRIMVEKKFLKEDKKQKIHGKLEDYFASAPLFTKINDKKNFDLRRLSEIFYQQIHANKLDKMEKTLTNLDFIEGKFALDMTYDFVNEFKNALRIGWDSWEGKNRAKKLAHLVQKHVSKISDMCHIFRHIAWVVNYYDENFDDLALQAAKFYERWAENYQEGIDNMPYSDILGHVAWQLDRAGKHIDSARKYQDIVQFHRKNNEIELVKLMLFMSSLNFEKTEDINNTIKAKIELADLLLETQGISKLAIETYEKVLQLMKKNNILNSSIKAKYERAKRQLEIKTGKVPAKTVVIRNEYDKIAADIVASYLYQNNINCSYKIPKTIKQFINYDEKYDYIILFGGVRAPHTGKFSINMFGNEKDYEKLYDLRKNISKIWIIDKKKSKYILIAGTGQNNTVRAAKMFVEKGYLIK
ncbi:MAG: DUF4062 domain-containing protein [Promethearchaeota archaeon]